MSAPLFSIGGIASGLPSDIVDQLMAVERAPLSRLNVRKNDLAVEKNAWSSITTRLSAVRSAVDKLRRVGSFAAFGKVASSDDTVVAATRTGSPIDQSLSFTVTQLAARERQAFTAAGDTFASLEDSLGGRTLQLKNAEGDVVFDTATTSPATLGALISDINAAKVGVKASALQVSPGQYQLVLTADQTGTANAFTTQTTGFGASTQLEQAKDATLTLGTTNPITVTRSSNTITDLVDGVTLTLKKTSTDPVTVTTSRDTEAAVAAVKKLVDEVNAAIAEVKKQTAYDAASGKSGPLNGDSTARRLADQLRSAVLNPTGNASGDLTLAGQVGISITREGNLSLDESKLQQALDADFAGVSALFSGGATSSVSGVRPTAWATASGGTHEVVITDTAKVASATGAHVPNKSANPATYVITTPSGAQITVTIDKKKTTSEAIALINNAIAAHEAANAEEVQLDIGTDVDGAGAEAITISGRVEGSANTFSIALDSGVDDWGLVGSFAGTDATVTDAEGTVFTGTGRSVTIDAGPSKGLALTVSGALGTSATITVDKGIGGAIDTALRAFEGIDGAIARAKDSLDSRTKILNDRITSFEARLETKEVALRRQFSALERLMGEMQSMGNWLAGQLGSLSASQQQQ